MLEKQVIKFLDYEIVNTGNGDGWVLLKPGAIDFQCHLGNYSDPEQAKLYAIHAFMVARPKVFAREVMARLDGYSIYHEWFTFKQQIEKENIIMPDEIQPSGDLNFTITFKGNKV